MSKRSSTKKCAPNTLICPWSTNCKFSRTDWTQPKARTCSRFSGSSLKIVRHGSREEPITQPAWLQCRLLVTSWDWETGILPISWLREIQERLCISILVTALKSLCSGTSSQKKCHSDLPECSKKPWVSLASMAFIGPHVSLFSKFCEITGKAYWLSSKLLHTIRSSAGELPWIKIKKIKNPVKTRSLKRTSERKRKSKNWWAVSWEAFKSR